MAEDFSCDPKVSSPDFMFSSMMIGDWYHMDEYPDNNFDGYGDYLNLMSHSHDILDMLPSDPFEMNISAGCTMIRGWIEEVDDEIEYRKDESEVKNAGDDGLFSGFDFVWTEATRIYPEIGDFKINGKGKPIGDEFDEEILHSSNESHENRFDGDVGSPPDALFFALGYLGMRDLLSVERVCKSLRDHVQNDPLLWRNIQIDQPPGESFTDDTLLQITNRASGSLQCLSLVKCLKITDNGLKCVFQQNPALTKLSVPGCVGLSVEGLVNNMKSLKSLKSGIKRLRIGGLHGVSMDQYDELKILLSVDNHNHLGSFKPRFYHGGQFYLLFDDDRPIDIEACPKCHQLRQVYDCPADSCQGQRNCCRACTFCIPRCISCGCCFNERDYMETFCLDFLCLDCLTQFLGFPAGDEEDMMSVSSKQNGFHQETSYHFCLYG